MLNILIIIIGISKFISPLFQHVDSSTCSVFYTGARKYGPLKELFRNKEYLDHPGNPGGSSKIEKDRIWGFIAGAFGLSTNVYIQVVGNYGISLIINGTH